MRCAMTIEATHAARRLLDLPRRAHRARRQDQGLRAEGPALRAAGRSGKADHHDRSRHRRRAVSRLPARAAGDQSARAQLAVLRPSAQAIAISSTRTSFRRCTRPVILTRLSLAWSRDGNEKVYVQHRMREVGSEVWSWLKHGAHVYVCGDALRMAKDVETRPDRHRRRTWRPHAGRGGQIRRRTKSPGALSGGCLLGGKRRLSADDVPNLRRTCSFDVNQSQRLAVK